MSAIRLSNNERAVLLALEEGRDQYAPFGHGCFSFALIAEHCSIGRHLIRRTVRSLARKGLAEFHKGLWNDDGGPAGAGYGLSKAGCDFLDALERGEQ